MPMIYRALRELACKKKRRARAGIPHAITLLNAVLGLMAINLALEGSFVLSAKLIMLAALVDGCDGRVARAMGLASGFGLELDSLCDAVSFCLAPAVLLYSWRLHGLGLAGTVATAIYMCAGLLRLAKFNITSDRQGSFFSGLPTPLAAIVLAGCVTGEAWLSVSRLGFLTHARPLSMVVIVLAFLMVSKVRFPAFKKGLAHARLALVPVVAFCICFAMCLVFRLPVLLLPFASYIITSCAMHAVTSSFAVR